MIRRFRRVYIEVSNVCNLKCDFCPTVHRDKLVMSPERFRQILMQVAPVTEEVCLHLMGEPLGHPQLGELVQTCAELGTPINLTTNGILLHGERRNIVLSPIVRQLNVSVHSFEANFKGQNPTAYLARLFRLTRDAMVVRPDLYINYRLWDLKDDVAITAEGAAVRHAIEREFGVEFDKRAIDPRGKKGFHLGGRVYAHFDSRFEWPSPAMPKRGTVGTCHGLSQHIGIHADSTVVPCCLDKEAVIRLGDLHSETLADILNSSRASAIREGFAGNRLIEDLCQRCTFIARFDRKARRQVSPLTVMPATG